MRTSFSIVVLYFWIILNLVLARNYILLPNVHEGFSEWRQIISRLFIIASHSRHTVVEPCIIDSSIAPCYAHGNKYSAIPLFSVFRIDYMRKQFPTVSIISWSEYLTIQRNNSFIQPVACIRMHSHDYNTNEYKTIMSGLNSTKHDMTQWNIQKCVEKHRNETIVVYKPWRQHMTIDQKHSPSHYFDFLPKYYELANNILTTAGINISNYVVIHWRSETAVNKEHIDCVRMLLNYASNWTKHLNSRSKPILVSDLSLRPNVKLWHTLAPEEQNLLSTSEKSLIKEEMLKIETSLVFQRFKNEISSNMDVMFDTVIDTIVSYNARMFVACMTTNNTVCRNCCRTISNFAEMIMERRRFVHLPSSDRWDLSSIFGPSALPSTIFTLDKLNNVSSAIPNMDYRIHNHQQHNKYV